jgi:hypothetical protein
VLTIEVLTHERMSIALLDEIPPSLRSEMSTIAHAISEQRDSASRYRSMAEWHDSDGIFEIDPENGDASTRA